MTEQNLHSLSLEDRVGIKRFTLTATALLLFGFGYIFGSWIKDKQLEKHSTDYISIYVTTSEKSWAGGWVGVSGYLHGERFYMPSINRYKDIMLDSVRSQAWNIYAQRKSSDETEENFNVTRFILDSLLTQTLMQDTEFSYSEALSVKMNARFIDYGSKSINKWFEPNIIISEKTDTAFRRMP